MYTPDLQTDYQQYLITCALNNNGCEVLSFREWLTRRTDKSLYEGRVFKQQPEAYKRVKL